MKATAWNLRVVKNEKHSNASQRTVCTKRPHMHADEDPRSNKTLYDIEETSCKSVGQSQQHRKEAMQSTPTAPSHYFTPLTENTDSSEQALLNQREVSKQALFKPRTRLLSGV